ncbi:hypothetical protein NW765_017339 [Fusarium oxysporum]|nr:hypothetical protein NW765_017339 [Fusarium oxysporum]
MSAKHAEILKLEYCRRQCDGSRPSCSQCRHTGRICAGYPPDFEFVSAKVYGRQPIRSIRSTTKKSRMTRRTTNPENCLTRTLTPAIQDAANLIIRSYVPENEIPWLNNIRNTQPRICGGWVVTLPELLVVYNSDELLPAAVKTLALSIVSKQQHRRETSPTIRQFYGSTLRLLQQSLTQQGSGYTAEHLAAMMCLTLTELMLGTENDAWMVHIDGISAMVQHQGSAFFAKGIPHRLFTGFRPLLVFKAIISRSSSFIAEQQWVSGPFRDIPATPMQNLLTEAVALPPILRRLDLLLSLQTANSDSEKEALEITLHEILQRLRMWEEEYQGTRIGPLYWALEDSTSQCKDVRLWFDDVTVANALTHYWAFTAICLLHIQKLQLLSQLYILDDTARLGYLRPLIKVCQSIPFLLQESLSLYGPSSVAFLLSTVVDTFRWNEEHGGTEVIVHEGVVDYAKSQGFYFKS